MWNKSLLIITLIQEKIRILVADDELTVAITLLLDAVKTFDINCLNEVIILSGGIKALEKEQRKGLIDTHAAAVERKKYFWQILNITDSLSPKRGEAN